MLVTVCLELIAKPDVGRLAFRRAGDVYPAQPGRGPFGTGALR